MTDFLLIIPPVPSWSKIMVAQVRERVLHMTGDLPYYFLKIICNGEDLLFIFPSRALIFFQTIGSFCLWTSFRSYFSSELTLKMMVAGITGAMNQVTFSHSKQWGELWCNANLVHLGYYTKYHRLGDFKTHKCVSHGSRGWEAWDQGASMTVFWWEPYFWFTASVFTWYKGWRFSAGSPFVRTLFPFMRVDPLDLHNFSKKHFLL